MEPAWEWHVGDPVGLGNDVGAPEVPYMGYVKRPGETEEERRRRQEEEEERRRVNEIKSRAKMLSRESWRLHEENRDEEALIFINRALEYWDREANYWNNKAIYLDYLNRYNEAIENYDKAIELKSSSEVFKHNKAVCLMNYGYCLKDREHYSESIAKSMEALEIFDKITNKECEDETWNLMGLNYEKLKLIPKAFECYKKAVELAKNGSEKKEIYKQNRDWLLQYIDTSDITCPNCKNKLKITDNFCLKCGYRFEMPIKLKKDYDYINEDLGESSYDAPNETIINIREN